MTQLATSKFEKETKYAYLVKPHDFVSEQCNRLNHQFKIDLALAAHKKAKQDKHCGAIDLLSVYKLVFAMGDDKDIIVSKWKSVLSDIEKRLQSYVETGEIPAREKLAFGILAIKI